MQFPNDSVFVGEEAKKRRWSQKHAKEIVISIDCLMADVASSQATVELDNKWDLWRRCAGIKLFWDGSWLWLVLNLIDNKCNIVPENSQEILNECSKH
jgi:hypothetical protein